MRSEHLNQVEEAVEWGWGVVRGGEEGGYEGTCTEQ